MNPFTIKTHLHGSAIFDASLLIITALLSFAPVAILAPAIGWPASLSAPPAQQLTALAAKASAVQSGYSVYLLYSILILPAMLIVAKRSFTSLMQPLAMLALTFAGLSVLARSIGILRWLTVMPSLANSYSLADASQRAMIEHVFQAVHSYGGGIGELLGVSIFMSLSVASISAAAFSTSAPHRMPLMLSGFGALVAVVLLSLSAPALGLPLPAAPVAIAVSGLSLWFLGLAVWIIIGRKSP